MSLAPFFSLFVYFFVFSNTLYPAFADEFESIQVKNLKRTYLLHLPKNFTSSKTYPLLILLHGRGSNGQKMAKLTGFSSLGDKEQFIAVYPNAINFPTLWNAFYKPKGHNRDDVAFIRKMLQELEGEFKIDPKKIYAVGFSSGGMFAYRIGAELSDKIAAIAVVSGSLGYRDDVGKTVYIQKPLEAVSALIIHGKKDSVVRMAGGKSFSVRTNLLSLKDSVNQWSEYINCEFPLKSSLLIEKPYEKKICRNKSGTKQVTLILRDKGKHEWPDFLVNENNEILPSNEVIWQFFNQHSK